MNTGDYVTTSKPVYHIGVGGTVNPYTGLGLEISRGDALVGAHHDSTPRGHETSKRVLLADVNVISTSDAMTTPSITDDSILVTGVMNPATAEVAQTEKQMLEAQAGVMFFDVVQDVSLHPIIDLG